MKLLIDVNLSPAWKEFLGKERVEAAHWSEIGANSASDDEILEYASRHMYIVLTRDLDFGSLLLHKRLSMPSVIQLRGRDVRPETFGAELLAVIAQLRSDLERGALVTLSERRTRLTVLPIRPVGR